MNAALAHSSTVVVDLSEADFIDSSVLHTLAWASAHGHTIVVYAPANGLARRVIHMAGLNGVLRIAETVDEAVGSTAAEPATD